MEQKLGSYSNYQCRKYGLILLTDETFACLYFCLVLFCLLTFLSRTSYWWGDFCLLSIAKPFSQRAQQASILRLMSQIIKRFWVRFWVIVCVSGVGVGGGGHLLLQQVEWRGVPGAEGANHALVPLGAQGHHDTRAAPAHPPLPPAGEQKALLGTARLETSGFLFENGFCYYF